MKLKSLSSLFPRPILYSSREDDNHTGQDLTTAAIGACLISWPIGQQTPEITALELGQTSDLFVLFSNICKHGTQE